jgi:hypothetical protein
MICFNIQAKEGNLLCKASALDIGQREAAKNDVIRVATVERYTS